MTRVRGKRRREATAASSREAGADPALDLLADVLRALGENAFAVGDLDPATAGVAFEAWARHLVVGSAEPEQPEPGEAVPLDRRNWSGARRFVVGYRRRERACVERSVSDLRTALWAFIHGLGEVACEDRTADERLKQQMTRVRRAVDSSATDAIRREAIAAVGEMGRVLAERRQRQREKFESLGARVRELREELESARAQMERDGLTQVYNRAALDEHLQRLVHLGSLFGHRACLFLIDVDHFKWVNDSFGHAAGDEVLRKLGPALERRLRRREDFVGRYGGDEMVVAVGEDDRGGASALAERLLQAVREIDVQRDARSVRVSASIGAALLEPGESLSRWLERADRALYRAKQAGRDRACVDAGSGST